MDRVALGGSHITAAEVWAVQEGSVVLVVDSKVASEEVWAEDLVFTMEVEDWEDSMVEEWEDLEGITVEVQWVEVLAGLEEGGRSGDWPGCSDDTHERYKGLLPLTFPFELRHRSNINQLSHAKDGTFTHTMSVAHNSARRSDLSQTRKPRRSE